MHAYASDDPVFRALEARGQRETGGALGQFCVRCHAPMAGTDLANAPRAARGVTCVFCHSIDDVAGDHNNPLVHADDGVMRGQLRSPLTTPAHASAYSPWLDGATPESSRACGSCHDVVVGELALEQTYAEWQTSLFAKPGGAGLSCAQCHMKGRDAPAAAIAGAPMRRTSSHAWPAIDVAMIAWPERDAQRAAIATDLAPSVASKLCVTAGAGGLDVEITLDNVLAGHAWPSGSTHARRAWVEVRARQGGAVVYESGVVPEGGDPELLNDPDLWLLGQRLYDAADAEVAMVWQATSARSTLLPPAVTSDRQDPRFYHAITRHLHVPVADEVTITLRLQPIGRALLDDLVASGDLAPSIAAAAPTYEITATRRSWHQTDGFGCDPR